MPDSLDLTELPEGTLVEITDSRDQTYLFRTSPQPHSSEIVDMSKTAERSPLLAKFTLDDDIVIVGQVVPFSDDHFLMTTFPVKEISILAP